SSHGSHSGLPKESLSDRRGPRAGWGAATRNWQNWAAGLLRAPRVLRFPTRSAGASRRGRTNEAVTSLSFSLTVGRRGWTWAASHTSDGGGLPESANRSSGNRASTVAPKPLIRNRRRSMFIEPPPSAVRRIRVDRRGG